MSSNFWTSGTGALIDGSPEKAFIREFSVIPNNTLALARIEKFELVNEKSKFNGQMMKFYQITWKLTAGEFSGQVVHQKIKTFEGKPEQIDKALHMLKLVMKLCQFAPRHQGIPMNTDLIPMLGKVLGIKVREWAMKKEDGSGWSKGNFVSEVHPKDGFVCETGVSIVVKDEESNGAGRSPRDEYDDAFGKPQSAIDRNRDNPPPITDDDIPF